MEEAVDLGGVHPREQVRIVGPVGHAVGCRALHAVVDRPDHRHRLLRIGDRSERGGAEKLGRPLQSTERIVLVGRVIGDARHGRWMQGLQEQRTDAADEHRRVGVHVPGRAVGPEQARLRRQLPWLALTGEQLAKAGTDPVTDRVDGLTHVITVRPRCASRRVEWVASLRYGVP